MPTSDPYVNIKHCLHLDDIATATVPDTTAVTAIPVTPTVDQPSHQ